MQTLLDASGIVKSFSGTTVLGDGRLDVGVGEIHALMGANGAGKSTLLKILTGVYKKDAGEILLADPATGELRPVEVTDPREATGLGIAIVHQELILSDNLTVADNISLGDEPMKWAGRVLDGRAAITRARDALALVGAEIDPRREVGSLSTAEKQLVEIAKSLSKDARLLILDEPTTSLTDSESRRLFEVLETLRARGIAIVYVSHRMEEIFAICDRITVMRDGRYVDTLTTADTSRDQLIRLMIGRSLAAEYADGHGEEHRFGEEALTIDGLSAGTLLHDISLSVRRGEIVGMFGLVGAGRTELARAVFGIDRTSAGTVAVAGRTLTRATPSRAISAGIALVPEDRKECGLVLDESIVHNMELASLRNTGLVQWTSRRAKKLWNDFSTSLGIVARGADQPVGTLSGGNQQKVVLAKWLALDPTVLILDEPTRGVDVGAKEDIYAIIRRLAADGAGVLVISSEIEEVLMIADRVIVMREGVVTLDAPNDGLDRHTLLSKAMGEAA
jgi:ribose transport system ATP-binding protein